MKTFATLCAVVIIAINTLSAQQQFHGQIKDNEARAVAFATVSLFKDRAPITATVTDSLGQFRLTVIPGRYNLQIRHLSYRLFEQPIEMASTDLGVFQLNEAAHDIQQVVVSAQNVTREADRFVVQVTSSAAMVGKDGVELLGQSPGVWIDDSGVAINGSTGVKVYVNDRELRLSGADLITYLRGINASNVARIEIIPLAGAEYSADTKGGVIKIILRRLNENGINGTLQINTIQGDGFQNYAPITNLYARIGKWSLNAAGSLSMTPEDRNRSISERQYDNPGILFKGQSSGVTRKNYSQGRLGAIYDLHPDHSLGLEVDYAAQWTRMPTNSSTIIDQYSVLTNSINNYDQSRSNDNLSATLNYIWNLDSLGSSLKFIVDYTRNLQGGRGDYNTHIETPYFQRDTLSRSNSSSDYSLLTAELAFKKILSRDWNLNVGLKYSNSQMSDWSLYEGKSSTGWEDRPQYSYDMNYSEDIAAGYAIVAGKIKRWTLSAGLRGEYTRTRGREDKVDQGYFRLFPTVSVNYALNQLNTWLLIAQYSNNIERPSFVALNPMRIQNSEYSYQIGNPALRPTFIHRISATAVFKYRYTLTVGGNLHRDLIREVSKIDLLDENVTYITPENHYLENHYFVALTAPFAPTNWWKLTFNFVGVMQDIKLTKNSPKATHYLMFADATSSFTMPHGFYAELSYKGNNKLYSGNSGIGARHIFNVTLKKEFLDRRVVVSAMAQNITNRSTDYFSIMDGFVNLTNVRSGWDSRYFKIGVTYNFRSGKSFKQRQIESAAQNQRDRLK